MVEMVEHKDILTSQDSLDGVVWGLGLSFGPGYGLVEYVRNARVLLKSYLEVRRQNSQEINNLKIMGIQRHYAAVG